MRGDAFSAEYKNFDKNLAKKLLKYLKPYKNYVFLAFIFTLFTSASAPLRPYLIKVAIDDYIAYSDFPGLLKIISLIFSVIILNGALQFLMTYIMQAVGQKTLFDIRHKIFKKLNKLPLSYFDKNPVGRIVTRLTNDVEGLNQFFSQGVVLIFADILLIIWIIIFMFYTSIELSIISLSILPLLFLATSLFRRKVRDLFRKLRLELASMNSFINENISGIFTIKIFNREKRQLDIFDRSNRTMKELNIKTIFYYAIFFPVVELIMSIALALVLWYSASHIFSGALSIGTLIAFLQFTEMFFRPVRDLSEKYTTLQSAMASAERVVELLELEVTPQINTKLNPLKFNEKIEFENVTFSYDGKTPVLRNVNFSINKGEKVAIVGATGSGKTTLIKLLTKFYENYDGFIKIDGTDIREISTVELRKNLALVMQDVFLFSRTIEENITMGNGEYSTAQLLSASEQIGLHRFITQFNNGYQTELNELGSNLSTGQRQLISFTRAFIRNPQILILDEATSNIDTFSEEIINQALDKLMKNRTSIIIAHRLSTIQNADKIIVLHKGEVKEIGTHTDLLNKRGIYYKLYQLQFQK